MRRLLFVLASLAWMGAGSACADEEASSTAATTTSTTSSTGAGGTTGEGGSGTSTTTSSSSGGGGAGTGGEAAGGAGGGVDLDGDGLDDAWEAKIAADYLPYLSLDPNDGCPLGGIVFRLRPHPDDPTRVHVVYDHLYQNDCGLGGHVGDDEVFGATIDPSLPPPDGLLALRAIGHQATLCETTSACGSAACGLSPCDTTDVGGKAWPVIFSSKDKHASYALLSACNPVTTCFDSCTLAPTSDAPPLVNVGEPNAPLVSNLTTQGFITAANGWTEASLLDFDPWDPAKDFGTAGNVAGDLTDDAFLTPACP